MSMKNKSNPQQIKYIEHKLNHCRQRFNWDCGIACIMMLLSAQQREYITQNLTRICQNEGFNHTTWSIDLCYLLRRFSIDHCMYTTVKGVNNRQAIGGRVLQQERKRVEMRFANADKVNILIKEKELSAEDLDSHVETRGPAIVLVDSSLLVCDLCKHNKLRAEFRRTFGGSYRGHYVVVVGHSGNKVLYRDPALSSRLCATSPARLHLARRSPGTDFDVILIYKDYR